MRVAILNYHSSVITIMVKNDNFLCVNCTIKTGTVREQVRNLLKRLLFSSRRGADPGLCEVFTGMRGCLSAMLEVLLCLVLASFLPMAVFLAVNGKYGKAFPHPYAPSHTYGVHRRTGQDEDAYVVSPAQSTG